MKNTDRNHTTFDLTFYQRVSITESFYPSLSVTELLTSLGGALGLWLGVGVVQLLDLGIKAAQFIKYFFAKKY